MKMIMFINPAMISKIVSGGRIALTEELIDCVSERFGQWKTKKGGIHGVRKHKHSKRHMHPHPGSESDSCKRENAHKVREL